MPVYEYKCSNGHKFERFLPVDRYMEPQQCECGASSEKQLSVLSVMPDLPGYQSPVDGRWIEGRSQRKEDLRRNNCVACDDGFKEESVRRSRQRDEALEKAVEETVEAEISKMPGAKREKLFNEIEAGASVEYSRLTPTGA